MHSHVDSADTDQDTPAQSHTETEEEGVLKKETVRHSYQHLPMQKDKARSGCVLTPLTSLHAFHYTQASMFLYGIGVLNDYACVGCLIGLFYQLHVCLQTVCLMLIIFKLKQRNS